MKVRALSSSPYVVLGVCWLSFRILTVILSLQKDCSDSPGFVQGFFPASCTTCLSLLKIYVKLGSKWSLLKKMNLNNVNCLE